MRTISRVEARPDRQLHVEFTDGSSRRFDARPLLSLEAFRSLADASTFMGVQNHGYFVEWSNGADLSADTLFHEGALQ